MTAHIEVERIHCGKLLKVSAERSLPNLKQVIILCKSCYELKFGIISKTGIVNQWSVKAVDR